MGGQSKKEHEELIICCTLNFVSTQAERNKSQETKNRKLDTGVNIWTLCKVQSGNIFQQQLLGLVVSELTLEYFSPKIGDSTPSNRILGGALPFWPLLVQRFISHSLWGGKIPHGQRPKENW